MAKYDYRNFMVDREEANFYFEKGQHCLKEESYQKALEFFEQARSLYERDARFYVGIGDCFYKLHKYDEAYAAYSKAISYDGKRIWAYIGRGNCLYQRGRYKEAQDEFRSAIDYAPGLPNERNRADAYRKLCIMFIDLSNYEKALDAYELMKKLDPKREVRLNQVPIKVRANRIDLYGRKGDRLLANGHYQEALDHFCISLQLASNIEQGNSAQTAKKQYYTFFTENDISYLNPKLANVYSGKGEAEFKLGWSADALRSYTEAIRLGSTDTRCFLRVGDFLYEGKDYEQSLEYYRQIVGHEPDDLSTQIKIIETCFRLNDNETSYYEYQNAQRIFNCKKTSGKKISSEELLKLPLMAGDIFTSFDRKEEAFDAYKQAFAQIKNMGLCLVAWNLPCLSRPAYVYLYLCKFICLYTTNLPSYEEQAKQAIKQLGTQYPDLFDTIRVSKEDIDVHVRVLQEILILFPMNSQGEMLQIIAQHNERQVAHLLIRLAPAKLLGLITLVQNVMAAWRKLTLSKDIVYRFYHVLPDYSISQEHADLFRAQCLLYWEEYKPVLTILAPHVEKIQPQQDSLWYTSEALYYLEHDPVQQITLLQRFITLFPDNTRVVDAYQRIGNLYWDNLNDGSAALAAYQEAAQHSGNIPPQLQMFYLGNWKADLFHLLPDYSFPPVIVIDIECDYKPDAPLGSRVYEVGAVRIKGNTELDTYQAFIQRDWREQSEAKSQEIVVKELQAFIDETSTNSQPVMIVGHNLRLFDAIHLRSIGLNIPEDQIVDTLELARLLYPDSLHHHLSLLCNVHGISVQGDYHNALPDARVCGQLLHVLGDEFIRRGEQFLNGVRSLVAPGSAFDKAILQPRQVPADPTIVWELDPTPTTFPTVLAYCRDTLASPKMQEALQSGDDLFVERNDPYGAYIRHLPTHQQSVVTVGTRTRLERMLSSVSSQDNVFVLPDAQTLLCPSKLRQSIEWEVDDWVKLTLFCLYQASHNHDSQALYPLRLPSSEQEFQHVRQALIASCCSSEILHTSTCSAQGAVEMAVKDCHLLLATHEAFLHQAYQPQRDLIVVDDIDTLQMRFATHIAVQLDSQRLQQWSEEVFRLLDTVIADYVSHLGDHLVAHERMHLRTLVPYLRESCDNQGTTPLARLKEMGAVGEKAARTLEEFCIQAEQEDQRGVMHAYWLDIWFSHQPETDQQCIERWQFNGLHCNLHDEFRSRFWLPYTQHILCGTAVVLGKQKPEFLEEFFGLQQKKIKLLIDNLPPRKIYIPQSSGEARADTIHLRPAGFLARKSWAKSVGMFLYHMAMQPVDSPLSVRDKRTLMITLHETAIAHAFANTFSSHEKPIECRVLAPSLGWTTAKIADRLVEPVKSTIAFISPFVRENSLGEKVAIEAIGPMRFLNQRDPLVAAHIRMFSKADSGIPMTGYLLPQAMLELKTRLSSPADVYVILDSGLRSKVYRDEIWELFKDDEMIDLEIPLDQSAAAVAFEETLIAELKKHVFSSPRAISAGELKQVLYSVWGLKEFRKSPLDQETIIQETLAGNDQLVIAATGGGKSLCFQLPAILLAQEPLPLVTLVISPLIALMINQVEALRKKGIFSAIALNSALSPEQKQSYLRGIGQGDYSIIYAAPEQIRSPQFRSALMKREIGLIAFDEAHCVSQWGHDFRTDYLVIKDWIERHLCSGGKRSFPLLALTATARKGYSSANHNEQSTILDIIENLGLQKDGKSLSEQDVQFVSSERSELLFEVISVAVRCPKCNETFLIESSDVNPICPVCGIVHFSKKKDERTKETYDFSECLQKSKLERLVSLLSEEGEQGLYQQWHPSDREQRQRGLVYCAYKKTTQKVVQALQADPKLRELNITCYHGGMKPESRRDVYQRFMRNELDIVVATNAFGMGIDIDRLGFVIHFDIPGTLENYYQEAGRAGRDPSFKDGKLKAHCILLYHENDLKKHIFLNNLKSISEQSMERVYDVLNHLRTPEEREIVISPTDIALLASVEEEQVKTILYYLEHHTHINGKPVLERGENAGNSKRQIRFERGYQQRLSEQSSKLVRVFQTSSQFQLNEEHTTVIDVEELALSLQQKQFNVTGEIKNLLSRHILVEASYSYVQWHKNQNDALEKIHDFIDDIQVLLHVLELQAKSQNTLSQRKIDLVNIYVLHKQYNLKTPFDIFCEMLFQLSKSSTKTPRLFSHFELATESLKKDEYKLRLEPTTSGATQKRVDLLQSYLRMTVDKLAEVAISDDDEENTWHAIDKLSEAPNYSSELSSAQSSMKEYEKRELLDDMLVLLAILKVLTLHKNEDEYQEMLHLIFKQTNVSPEEMRDNIKVDLYKFRLMEHYSERKLETMQRYAEISDRKYVQYFNDYFSGTVPLLAPFKLPDELTEQQQLIVMLTKGYHRIDGPPGSGKTHTLQEHLKYLVEYKLVPPDHILVATHYKSAVNRISHHSEDLKRKRRNIRAKTLNSLGDDIFKHYRAELIRPDGEPYYAQEVKLDLRNGSKVKGYYDTVQYTLLREAKELLSQAILAAWPAGLPSAIDLQRIKLPGFIDNTQCLDFINRLREYGIFPVLNENAQNIRDAARSLGLLEQKMSVYYTLYRAYLVVQARCGMYTYDDQILFALAILNKHPHIARRYQRTFEHIIVDEYQDLTSAEVQLLQLFSQKYHHIMLFGDLKQNIRLAKTSNKAAIDLPLLRHAQCHNLITNFRCVQEILTLAHAVLGNTSRPVQEAARGTLNKRPGIIFVEKQLSSATPSNQGKQNDGEEGSLLEAMVDAALDRMKTLHARDIDNVGFIVARSDDLDMVSRYLENEKKEYLQRKHINLFLMKNEYSYQSNHIQRMLTYFRLICNEMIEKDIEYLLQYCLIVPFTNQDIQSLKELAQSKEMTLIMLLKDQSLRNYWCSDPEQAETLDKHLLLLDQFGSGDNARLLWNAINGLPGGPMELQKQKQTEEMKQKIQSVDDSLTIPKKLEQMTVQELLDHVSGHVSFLPTTSSNNIVLTTIDYAKSQEFSTVFLIGADGLKDNNRWYVAVTRARNRFFCLVNKSVDSNLPILKALRPSCIESYWPEQQDKLYTIQDYTKL